VSQNCIHLEMSTMTSTKDALFLMEPMGTHLSASSLHNYHHLSPLVLLHVFEILLHSTRQVTLQDQYHYISDGTSIGVNISTPGHVKIILYSRRSLQCAETRMSWHKGETPWRKDAATPDYNALGPCSRSLLLVPAPGPCRFADSVLPSSSEVS
jgi:hypothetical protein